MRVVVRIAQLVRDAIEQHIARLGAQFGQEPLVQLHRRRVRQCRGRLLARLLRGDARHADVEDESVDEGDARRAVGVREARAQLDQEREWLARLEERVEVGQQVGGG